MGNHTISFVIVSITHWQQGLQSHWYLNDAKVSWNFIAHCAHQQFYYLVAVHPTGVLPPKGQ